MPIPEIFKILLLVGGKKNGEQCLILANAKLIRLPVFKETQLWPSEYPETVPEPDYQTYERREYTDANKVKREFLVLKSLSDAQAAMELYLLGILDIDENYETKEPACRATN